MTFRFRACSGRISSIPILHCTKSRGWGRLQSSDQRWFGPETKAPLRRQANRRAEWSSARHDADRPDAGNGIEQEFGAAHSSSQRSSDTIGNTPPPSCQSLLMTPAGPPPPAGVIVFAEHLANPSTIRNLPPPRSSMQPFLPCSAPACRTHAADAWVPFQSRAFAQRPGRLYLSHRSGDDLLLPTSPPRIGSPSSSQAANRYQQCPPDLLPRRALLFCTATNQSRMAYLPLWRRARILAKISPKFPLDMHKTHGCHTAIALSFFAAQRIFQSIRSGRRQRRAAAQYASPRKG